jgi:hypothetical protein
MMEMKDYVSFLVGLIIFTFGLLPLLNKFGVGPDWFNFSAFLPTAVFAWIVAVAALYLVVDSVIEITNSSSIGFISIIIAFVCLAIGILPILNSFGIGPEFFGLGFFGSVVSIVYSAIYMIEGIFLMLAMIYMEL